MMDKRDKSKKKDIISFLEHLRDNNNKEWMEANREWYLKAKADLLEVVGRILHRMVAFEPGFAGLEPKDCIFRQNRDLRFTPDKRPYKNNMSAYFAQGGKKSQYPGYYLHIEPGGSFLGAGVYSPSPEILKKIRQEIDYSGQELSLLLQNREFNATFGEIKGERLKTPPKGYSSDHPFLHFLKMKHFIVSKSLSNTDIRSPGFAEKTVKNFFRMKPFNDFFAKAMEPT